MWKERERDRQQKEKKRHFPEFPPLILQLLPVQRCVSKKRRSIFGGEKKKKHTYKKMDKQNNVYNEKDLDFLGKWKVSPCVVTVLHTQKKEEKKTH